MDGYQGDIKRKSNDGNYNKGVIVGRKKVQKCDIQPSARLDAKSVRVVEDVPSPTHPGNRTCASHHTQPPENLPWFRSCNKNINNTASSACDEGTSNFPR